MRMTKSKSKDADVGVGNGVLYRDFCVLGVWYERKSERRNGGLQN